MRPLDRNLASLPALGLFLLASCQATSHQQDTIYVSAADRAHHDTELARQLNADAVSLIEQGAADQAEPILRRALAADVMYGPAHNSLGRILYARGQYYQAAWEFEYAIKLMPHRPESRNNLGLVFEARGDLDRAIENFERALQIDRELDEARRGLLRARAARAGVQP